MVQASGRGKKNEVAPCIVRSTLVGDVSESCLSDLFTLYFISDRSQSLDPVGPVAKVRPLANDAQAAKVGTIASKEYPNSACLIMDFQRFSKDFQWIPADSPYISADFPLIFHGFSRILHGFPWIFHRIPRRPLPFLGQDFFPKTRVRNSDSCVNISYLKIYYQ